MNHFLQQLINWFINITHFRAFNLFILTTRATHNHNMKNLHSEKLHTTLLQAQHHAYSIESE